MDNAIPLVGKTRLSKDMAAAMDDFLAVFAGLNRQDSANIFYALNAANYEIRHAAFFSWLFDPSRYRFSDHFIACFFSEIAKHIDLDPGVASGVEAYIEKQLLEGFLEVSPVRKGGRYTEIVLENKKRIDFAADVAFKDGRRRAGVRLVIEFKKQGDMKNDLDVYERFARESNRKELALVCFVLDVCGKHHAIDHDSFGEVPGGALIAAVRRHLQRIGKIRDPGSLREQIYIKDYLSVLESYDGRFLAPYDQKKRRLLWKMWNPMMEHPQVHDGADSEYSRLLEKFSVRDGEGPLVDALSSYCWSWLMVESITHWLPSASGLQSKPYGNTDLRIFLPGMADPSFYWLVVPYDGGRLGKAYKDKIFIRLVLLNYQAVSNATESNKNNWRLINQLFSSFLSEFELTCPKGMEDEGIRSGHYSLILQDSLELVRHTRPSVREWSMGIHINIPVSYKELEQVCVRAPLEPPRGGSFSKLMDVIQIMGREGRRLTGAV